MKRLTKTKKWDEVYKTIRDSLIENIGRSGVYPYDNNAQWHKYLLEKLKDFLDIIDVAMQEINGLTKRNDELTKRLEKRDDEITDVLVTIQNWMKKYQPILDKMGEENDLLGKVGEH